MSNIRSSPSIRIARMLPQNQPSPSCSDPYVDDIESISVISSDDAIAGADIVVFLVPHRKYFGVDVNDKIILDFCGVTRKSTDP